MNIGDTNAPDNLAVGGSSGDTSAFEEVANGCRLMLAASQRCTFTLRFAPPAGTSTGTKSAVWTVGVGSAEAKATLTGEVTP